MPWKDLSREARIGQIIDALILQAVGAVDPVNCHRYIIARAEASDITDAMRLDIDFWHPLVVGLREKGMIPSAEEVRLKAESMVSLSSKEMRQAVDAFHEEVKNAKETNLPYEP